MWIWGTWRVDIKAEGLNVTRVVLEGGGSGETWVTLVVTGRQKSPGAAEGGTYYYCKVSLLRVS